MTGEVDGVVVGSQPDEKRQVIVAGKNVLDAESQVVQRVIDRPERLRQREGAIPMSEDVLSGSTTCVNLRQALMPRVEIEKQVVSKPHIFEPTRALKSQRLDDKEAFVAIG